jgi:hypothetical protein
METCLLCTKPNIATLPIKNKAMPPIRDCQKGVSQNYNQLVVDRQQVGYSSFMKKIVKKVAELAPRYQRGSRYYDILEEITMGDL